MLRVGGCAGLAVALVASAAGPAKTGRFSQAIGLESDSAPPTPQTVDYVDGEQPLKDTNALREVHATGARINTSLLSNNGTARTVGVATARSTTLSDEFVEGSIQAEAGNESDVECSSEGEEGFVCGDKTCIGLPPCGEFCKKVFADKGANGLKPWLMDSGRKIYVSCHLGSCVCNGKVVRPNLFTGNNVKLMKSMPKSLSAWVPKEITVDVHNTDLDNISVLSATGHP